MSQRQLVTESVINLIESRGQIPGDSLESKLACAYLDQGVLDSMQMVELIVRLEARWGVKFRPDDLQSDSFRKVGGVIDTVLRHLA